MSVYLHCNCTGTAIVPYTPPCPDGDCLIITSPITACEDSTPPEGSGNLDLGALNTVTVCDGCTPTYSLMSWDPLVFPVIALDPNTGVLTWTAGSAANAVPGSFYQVSYRVDCACMNLASQGIISICIRDLCGTVSCPEGEACDPTTGLCVPISDIEVS